MTPFLGFNTFQPLVSNSPAAGYTTLYTPDSDSGSSSKKGASLGGLTEDMMKMLYKDGLKSDVEGFLEQMEFAIDNAYNPITGKPNTAMYKLILPKLMQIKNEKDNYDKALEEVRKKDAMNDYAVSPDGLLFVMYLLDGLIKRGWMDSDKLIAQFGANFAQNTNLHIATNGELAKERATSVAASFNTDMSNILAGATGILDITKYIKNTIPELGKTINELLLSKGASKNLAESLQLSVAALLDLISGLSTKNREVSQGNQATLALNYILNMMPKNMQTLLKVLAAASGLTINALLESYIGSKMNYENTKADKLNSGKSGNNGQGNEYDGKMTAPMMFALGYGPLIPIKWHTRNTTFSLDLNATASSITAGNKPIGMTSLTKVANSDFGPLLNMDQVTFGDVLISGVMGNNILVDSNRVYKVDLPIDPESYAQGIIKPDVDLLDKLQIVERQIVNLRITDPKQINELYLKEGLPVAYAKTKDGKRTYKFTGPHTSFAAMSAYATEQAFLEDLEDLLNTECIQEITDERERLEVEKLLKVDVDKESQTDFDGTNGWFLSDSLYKSMIYIPINKHWTSSMLTNSATEMPSVTEARDELEPLLTRLMLYEQSNGLLNPPI